MEHDYYYVSLGLSYGELASIDQTDGMIRDKMGNVYFYSELGGGLGVSTPVQGSVGFGDFYSDDKENSGEYRDAIKGESAGFNIDMGVQFGVSKGANSPVARDVGITSGVGCSVSESSETSLDFGKFASEQISAGYGNYNGRKNNVDDYVNSIAGESAGVNIAAGGQVGVSSWNNAPISTEVGVTTGVGVSVGFRETKRIFNIYS